MRYLFFLISSKPTPSGSTHRLPIPAAHPHATPVQRILSVSPKHSSALLDLKNTGVSGQDQSIMWCTMLRSDPESTMVRLPTGGMSRTNEANEQVVTSERTAYAVARGLRLDIMSPGSVVSLERSHASPNGTRFGLQRKCK